MNNIKVTYIGHSTVLIEADGKAIITDPNFSDKVLFIKRARKFGYDLSKLPNLDTVLISHLHFDHFDIPSFSYFNTEIPLVVPEGSAKHVRSYLTNPVIELAHFATHQFKDGLKIHAVPANHPSCPLCPSRYKHAAGYMIEIGDKKIFFAGDTAYHSSFKDIGNTYSIDLALLPIGCYKPAFFMKRFHLDPLEAVQAFSDLNAKQMVPIHFGEFRLSLEKLDEPITWLRKIIEEKNLSEKVHILLPGQSLDI